MTIKASPERCYGISADFECYVEWASDIKEVEIVSRDAQGRAVRVAFRAAAMGRSTRYILEYDYSVAPEGLSWHLIEGDLESRLDGRLVFDGCEDGTEVTYHLAVELKVPVPGFLKRRAETRILDTLDELRVQAESRVKRP